jgi:hypothetical protein
MALPFDTSVVCPVLARYARSCYQVQSGRSFGLKHFSAVSFCLLFLSLPVLSEQKRRKSRGNSKILAKIGNRVLSF